MPYGYKSRWWARYNHLYERFGMWELVDLLWLQLICKKGMLGMEYDRNVRKKIIIERINYDRRWWRNSFGIDYREQEYLQVKIQPKNEKWGNEGWEKE